MNKKNENTDVQFSINNDNSKFQSDNHNSFININNQEKIDESDIKKSKEINKQINQLNTDDIKNEELIKKSKKTEQVESGNNSSQININIHNSPKKENLSLNENKDNKYENIDFREKNNNFLNNNNNDLDESKKEFIQF